MFRHLDATFPPTRARDCNSRHQQFRDTSAGGRASGADVQVKNLPDPPLIPHSVAIRGGEKEGVREAHADSHYGGKGPVA
jgi:hypothetical protein